MIGDREQPTHWPTARNVKPPRSAPDLQECLLGDFFCFGMIPQQPLAQRPYLPLVACVQSFESIYVARRDSGEEFGLAPCQIHSASFTRGTTVSSAPFFVAARLGESSVKNRGYDIS